MKTLTDEQWWKLCNCGGAGAEDLTVETATCSSFVYDRTYGLFPTDSGSHNAVMTLILSWHYGLNSIVDVTQLLGTTTPADVFLQRPGTAFKSSQSKVVEAYEPECLNEWELKIFKKVRYINHD